MVKIFAGVVGAALLLLGLGGILLGDDILLGVLNIDIVEDVVHVISGGLLLFAAFGRAAVARSIVGAIGVAYLLVGILGFVLPTLLGLIPHGYTVYDNFVHLLLGVLGILVAATSRLPEAERRAANPRA